MIWRTFLGVWQDLKYSDRKERSGKINQRSHFTKMPYDPSLYPDNWHNLALEVKVSSKWRCSCCGKKCYEPGSRPEGLTRSEWTADILQVHHRNHDTTDNRLSNLMSVCAACHLSLHFLQI